MTQNERDGYSASRLIGLMIWINRSDRQHAHAAMRDEARAWLESQDEGLGSLVTGCRHLASNCMRMPQADLEAISNSLSMGDRGEALTDASTWEGMARGTDVPNTDLLKAIERVAAAAYPGAAPELEARDPDIAPPESSDFDMGPGR